jgi:hypothetical protein
VLYSWPKKTEKVSAVLTPISEITSLKPRVEVKPGVSQGTIFGPDAKMMSRQVLVKIVDPATGRRLFRSGSHKIEPEGQPVMIALEREPNEACPRDTHLRVEVHDADNDELVDHCEAELKVDMEEWD